MWQTLISKLTLQILVCLLWIFNYSVFHYIYQIFIRIHCFSKLTVVKMQTLPVRWHFYPIVYLDNAGMMMISLVFIVDEIRLSILTDHCLLWPCNSMTSLWSGQFTGKQSLNFVNHDPYWSFSGYMGAENCH